MDPLHIANKVCGGYCAISLNTESSASPIDYSRKISMELHIANKVCGGCCAISLNTENTESSVSPIDYSRKKINGNYTVIRYHGVELAFYSQPMKRIFINITKTRPCNI